MIDDPSYTVTVVEFLISSCPFPAEDRTVVMFCVNYPQESRVDSPEVCGLCPMEWFAESTQ